MDSALKIKEKEKFTKLLKQFAQTLPAQITKDGEWTVKGFVDIYKNLYTISLDTKVISKVMEIHLFPSFAKFAQDNGYIIEPASRQNYYYFGNE